VSHNQHPAPASSDIGIDDGAVGDGIHGQPTICVAAGLGIPILAQVVFQVVGIPVVELLRHIPAIAVIGLGIAVAISDGIVKAVSHSRGRGIAAKKPSDAQAEVQSFHNRFCLRS